MRRNVVQLIIEGINRSGPAFDKAEKDLKAIRKVVDPINDALLKVGLGVSAAVTAAVERSTRLEVGLGNLATTTGLSINWLSEFDYALRTVGGSADDVQSSIRSLVANMIAAQKGDDAAKALFNTLKVAPLDATRNFRPLNDVFDETINYLAGMKDDTERLALAQQIFGKGAFALTGILAQGTGEMARLREEARRLGASLSPESVKEAKEYRDAMERARASLDAAARSIATTVLPALTRYTNWLAFEGIPKVRAFTEEHGGLVKAIAGAGFGALVYSSIVKPLLEIVSTLLAITAHTPEAIKALKALAATQVGGAIFGSGPLIGAGALVLATGAAAGAAGFRRASARRQSALETRAEGVAGGLTSAEDVKALQDELARRQEQLATPARERWVQAQADLRREGLPAGRRNIEERLGLAGTDAGLKDRIAVLQRAIELAQPVGPEPGPDFTAPLPPPSSGPAYANVVAEARGLATWTTAVGGRVGGQTAAERARARMIGSRRQRPNIPVPPGVPAEPTLKEVAANVAQQGTPEQDRGLYGMGLGAGESNVVKTLVDNFQKLQESAGNAGDVIVGAFQSAGDAIGNVFGNAIESGRLKLRDFGQAFKSVFAGVVAEITGAIVKFLLFNAIISFIPGLGKLFPGGLSLGSFLGKKEGGLVPTSIRAAGVAGMLVAATSVPVMRAQGGGIVPGSISGFDHVPALLEPGELVVPRQDVEAAKARARADAARTAPLLPTVKIAPPSAGASKIRDVNVTVAPGVLLGDRAAARELARTIQRELNYLNFGRDF